MRNELTKTKEKMLVLLYTEKCIPASQLDLYCEYLMQTKNIEIGRTYLYRILRELISMRYVERIKVGYQQKGVTIKSFENPHGYKIKNIYRLTVRGRRYVEAKEELGLKLNEVKKELEKENSGTSTSETLFERKKELIQENSEAEGFVLRSAMENERTVRLLKTDLFGKVCEASSLLPIKFIDNDEMKKGIINKGTFSSKCTGAIKCVDKEGHNHLMPIYNLGGSISAQSKKTERKMKIELENKYRAIIEEEIILGENYETLVQNIKTLIARRQAKQKQKITKKPKTLIIENDTSHRTTKYYHNIGVDGVNQMEIYNIPKEVRKQYYYQRLSKDAKLNKYFTDKSIKNAENSTIFSAITPSENIYVGYEINVEEIVMLISQIFNTSKKQSKKIIIICQKSQKELYDKIFNSETFAKSKAPNVEILTTEYYI